MCQGFVAQSKTHMYSTVSQKMDTIGCSFKYKLCFETLCPGGNNREVEQTQLVRVRVTSFFVDDIIIICVPRTCSTSYTFAWTCKLWSTRLSLRVDIAIKWRWESPLHLYKMVFMSFKNEKIQQKCLELTKLVTKSDHTLRCWNRIFYTYTYTYA